MGTSQSIRDIGVSRKCHSPLARAPRGLRQLQIAAVCSRRECAGVRAFVYRARSCVGHRGRAVARSRGPSPLARVDFQSVSLAVALSQYDSPRQSPPRRANSAPARTLDPERLPRSNKWGESPAPEPIAQISAGKSFLYPETFAVAANFVDPSRVLSQTASGTSSTAPRVNTYAARRPREGR